MKQLLCVISALLILCLSSVNTLAYSYNDLPKGTHQIKTELSCYVNAMGGVEFGAPLLTSSVVNVASDGSKTLTLYFTKSQVTIYSITCDTFIDVAPSYVTDTNGVKSGTLGYYNANGALVTDKVTYTLSDDTAENAQKEQIHYVDSITFPIEFESNNYDLTLYINSNVMGCQFGDGSGTGSSNQPGVSTSYKATLTIDWDSAEKIAVADETSSQSANVEYTVTGGYEVEIPSTITVDSTTKKGTYTVTAQNFILDDTAYVTVTANESGKLVSGSDELAFTNSLEDGKLAKDGDSLAGTVEVTENATNPGKYTGTIDFTISYFSGK